MLVAVVLVDVVLAPLATVWNYLPWTSEQQLMY
jgi:hypothetical protein